MTNRIMRWLSCMLLVVPTMVQGGNGPCTPNTYGEYTIDGCSIYIDGCFQSNVGWFDISVQDGQVTKIELQAIPPKR